MTILKESIPLGICSNLFCKDSFSLIHSGAFEFWYRNSKAAAVTERSMVFTHSEAHCVQRQLAGSQYVLWQLPSHVWITMCGFWN